MERIDDDFAYLNRFAPHLAAAVDAKAIVVTLAAQRGVGTCVVLNVQGAKNTCQARYQQEELGDALALMHKEGNLTAVPVVYIERGRPVATPTV